jgi:hypothetical protein
MAGNASKTKAGQSRPHSASSAEAQRDSREKSLLVCELMTDPRDDLWCRTMEKSLVQSREFSASAAYQRLINSHETDAAYRTVGSRSRISEGLRFALAP